MLLGSVDSQAEWPLIAFAEALVEFELSPEHSDIEQTRRPRHSLLVLAELDRRVQRGSDDAAYRRRCESEESERNKHVEQHESRSIAARGHLDAPVLVGWATPESLSISSAGEAITDPSGRAMIQSRSGDGCISCLSAPAIESGTATTVSRPDEREASRALATRRASCWDASWLPAASGAPKAGAATTATTPRIRRTTRSSASVTPDRGWLKPRFMWSAPHCIWPGVGTRRRMRSALPSRGSTRAR